MTLKEYLTAHEGEKGLPETLHGITPEQAIQKLAAQSVDLTDEELALVAGGIEFQSDSNAVSYTHLTLPTTATV